ncbi:Ankyrin-1, partial [Mycoblastus sanguinarius]|nr:Ankyrin-1 [Mycoblastus sanguinarius]
MDPVSIIALIEGSLSLALQCGSVAKSLSDIAGKHKYAQLTILSISQGLETIQLAWSQIGEWSQNYSPENGPDNEEFLRRLHKFLENGAIIMSALEEDLLPYQADSLSFKQRSKAVWNERTLQDHQNRISHQATAMTCLLQAIQLKSSQARNQVLDEAAPVLRKSDESAYSIVPSRMSRFSIPSSASLSSADLSYHRLSFEDALFTARVYKRNYRNPLIGRLFKSRRQQLQGRERGQGHVSSSSALSDAFSGEVKPVTSVHDEMQSQRLFAVQRVIKQNCFSVEDIRLLQACGVGDRGHVLNNLRKRRQSQNSRFFQQELSSLGIILEAVINGQTEVVKILLDFDIPIDGHWGPCGWNLLQFAAHRGDSTMAEFLLSLDVPTFAYDYSRGSHPLHIAAHVGSLDVTRALLDTGVLPSVLDIDGFQPLHVVSTYPNRSDQIALLIRNGAEVDAEVPSNIRTWQRRPLQLACANGRIENVQTLLELGAEPNVSESLFDTPLGLAIQKDSVDIAF